MRDPVLARQTDLCVKCGLCLPHCPTYVKTQDENESPRGRLSLIQGWARNELEADETLKNHVDQCLLCRACETVCPAYVPYGEIVDRFRGQTTNTPHRTPWFNRTRKFLIRKILEHTPGGSLESHILDYGNKKFAKRIGRWMGFGDLMEGLPLPSPWPQTLATPASPMGASTDVQLFLGCTAGLMDRETVRSIPLILERLGISVSIPENQTCCGAMDQHNGQTEIAQHAAKQNIHAFSISNETTPVISFASGCSSMLKDYDQLLTDSESSKGFSRRIVDISAFLAEKDWPENCLAPLDQTVCLHTPCSLRNGLRQHKAVGQLLQKIPQLKVVNLPERTMCCGAAGTYMIDHPTMARELRQDVIDAILATGASTVLTSNPGCATHLRGGLEAMNRGDIKVVHPVTLLAEQLN